MTVLTAALCLNVFGKIPTVDKSGKGFRIEQDKRTEEGKSYYKFGTKYVFRSFVKFMVKVWGAGGKRKCIGFPRI